MTKTISYAEHLKASRSLYDSALADIRRCAGLEAQS